MGRHFAAAFRELAQPPYTDDYLAKVLEREPSTFFRIRHNQRHPSLHLVYEIAAALTPDPEHLRQAPHLTYKQIARTLVTAYLADEEEVRLHQMSKRSMQE